MSESTIAYVVSTGEYSDYRVLCVCPTRQDAKQVVAKYTAEKNSWGGTQDARVELLPIVTGDVEPVPVLTMTANIWDSGRVEDLHNSVRNEWPFGYGAPYPGCAWRWVRAPVHGGAGGRLEATGTDLERVRRVFSDRRAMLMTDDAMRAKRGMSGRV